MRVSILNNELKRRRGIVSIAKVFLGKPDHQGKACTAFTSIKLLCEVIAHYISCPGTEMV